MTAPEKRAIELLVDRVTEGLEPALKSELDALLADLPDLDPESFELAAAAVDLACEVPREPLPAALRQRLVHQARQFYTGEAEPAPASQRADSAEAGIVAFPTRPASDEKPRGVTRWLGWMAAAAGLVLAVAGWWPASEKRLDPSAARADFMARTTDLVELEWRATKDPAARRAGGDVVWSSALQTGYMRFSGLPVNDPGVEQYQLWIFDAEQDERYPIDGGVFDISSEGEVVVPIAAKLRVVSPTLFAVTIEKPGGVVVSSRERLPLVAGVG